MNQPINAPKPQFRLTNGQRASEAWLVIKAHLQDELDLLRQRNDGDHDAIATAKIRGQIAHVKAMLALDKDLPIPPPG